MKRCQKSRWLDAVRLSAVLRLERLLREVTLVSLKSKEIKNQVPIEPLSERFAKARQQKTRLLPGFFN